MELKQMDVPIGARVFINGMNYECTSIKQRESQKYDCSGCSLYTASVGSCSSVACTGDVRKDGQWVVFKEVKK